MGRDVNSAGTAPRRSRAEWVADVEGLHRCGYKADAIAREFGLSHSYVRDLLSDPSGERGQRRKDGYRRPCPGFEGPCGTLMDGSNGLGPHAPMLCKTCAAAKQHAERRWTAEAIIDAIQRFAKAHGRPPTSTEWLARTDPVNGYPCVKSVFRTGHRSSASNPFASWAEAVEAAGFERPRIGGYRRSDARYTGRGRLTDRKKIYKGDENGRSKLMRKFVILEQDGDSGSWFEHDPVEALSEALAVETFADLAGKLDGSGVFVAVAEAHWTLRRLEPVTTVKAVAVQR